MGKFIKIALLATAFVVAIVAVLRCVPPNPVAIITVVDATGKPVSGAVIATDGLRPKRINGHWGWTDDNDVKPNPVTTDARGIARVPYPRYVFEKTETGEISFSVNHPDFVSDRPFRVVSAAPPLNAKLQDHISYYAGLLTGRTVARPDPVVLQRGGIVEVSGYIGSKETIFTNIHAQLATLAIPRKGFWMPAEHGALINRRVPEGTNAARLVYFPPNGRTCFSDIAGFVSVPGQTNEFSLELKPGFQLSGRLDDSVPRPVTEGRVEISDTSESITTNGGRLSWRAWATINPDGTFSFASLPSGKVEIIASCDGFKSTSGQPRIANFCMPQVVLVSNQDASVVIGMEPTAACEFTITDDQMKPLPGASIYFWPNVIWNGVGSTIFMGWTYNSEDLFRSDEDFDWRKASKNWPPVYHGVTDSRGIAVVSNLPAFNQFFSVDQTNFELPVDSINNSRESKATLQPGETSHISISLQKKGTQFVQSPR